MSSDIVREIIREIDAVTSEVPDGIEVHIDSDVLKAWGTRLRASRDEVETIVRGFLECPEIADCAPDDKDPETDALERRARRILPPPQGGE